MALLIYPDGRSEVVVPRNTKKFELEEMQKLVGGYIQPCNTKDKRRMVVDEDGKPKGRPLNLIATELYQYGDSVPIVGIALVGTRRELGV